VSAAVLSLRILEKQSAHRGDAAVPIKEEREVLFPLIENSNGEAIVNESSDVISLKPFGESLPPAAIVELKPLVPTVRATARSIVAK
jgi:hypothetical protein